MQILAFRIKNIVVSIMIIFIFCLGIIFPNNNKIIKGNTKQKNLKYSIIEKNYILNQKNAVELSILLEKNKTTLTKEKIIELIKKMKKKYRNLNRMLIYGYLSKKAYEELIEMQHTEEYKNNFLFLYVKSGKSQDKGSIYWFQLKGKFSHLYGSVTDI
ncbi:MAG: hypothetical protein FXF47_03880 [Candidatus Mcinerneyibacterium aminivorans]|uniref:Uncharacterized protein n=1 Tax=Candidatus Mcinerneyibacterium aminivorans TaxID=2703815 RepID=A0A5D0MCI9_9BACT|nr:MAG: hypothetical protein FXF47_03880 [Candidatus Mcinerneyibacterium aminivorans]